MPNVGNVGVRIFLNDKLTPALRKAGASVKKFGNLTDKQMDRVQKASQKLDKFGKGIVLMHDFQKHTAEALPELMKRLKAGGYKVVHLKPGAGGGLLVASAKTD